MQFCCCSQDPKGLNNQCMPRPRQPCRARRLRRVRIAWPRVPFAATLGRTPPPRRQPSRACPAAAGGARLPRPPNQVWPRCKYYCPLPCAESVCVA